MKYYLLFALAFLAAACNTAAPAPTLQTGVHLQAEFQTPKLINGEPPSHPVMNYLIYFPEGYEQNGDEKWPLIMFLHGAGDDDNDSAFVIGQGLPEVLYYGEEPEDFPFIVVSPQAFFNTAWWSGDSLEVLIALLDEVIANYNVDPSRVYLTGLSMGGYGSWFLATRYPDRFAAMVSVSGSGYRTSTIPSKSFMCPLAEVPVWVIHGEQDTISIPEASRQFAFALETECGGEVKLTMYPDAGHFKTFVQAYRDPELYTWLLEHSR